MNPNIFSAEDEYKFDIFIREYLMIYGMSEVIEKEKTAFTMDIIEEMIKEGSMLSKTFCQKYSSLSLKARRKVADSLRSGYDFKDDYWQSSECMTTVDVDVYETAYIEEIGKQLVEPQNVFVGEIICKIHKENFESLSEKYKLKFRKRDTDDNKYRGLLVITVWPEVRRRLVEKWGANCVEFFLKKETNVSKRVMEAKKRRITTETDQFQLDINRLVRVREESVGMFVNYEQYIRSLAIVLVQGGSKFVFVIDEDGQNRFKVCDECPDNTSRHSSKILLKAEWIVAERIFFPYRVEMGFGQRVPVLSGVSTSVGTTIGDGVYVKKSTLQIKDCNGLFANKEFKDGEIITEYEGWKISRSIANKMYNIKRHGFLKAVGYGGNEIIDGLRYSLHGFGGAQFANSMNKRDTRWNASIEIIEAKQGEGRKIVLKAKKTIQKNVEIFCYYGCGKSLEFEQM